jgi:hypothetical protein
MTALHLNPKSPAPLDLDLRLLGFLFDGPLTHFLGTASIFDFATPHAAPVVISLVIDTSSLTTALNAKIIPAVKKELLAYHDNLTNPRSPLDGIGTYSPANK